ncbi:unnamed protein product [Prorocentrum cordatum]|uniref:Uncharacterized protein n=1 Tax=Prorocentrum cordatum TaxID=2364126 RepID=A0ABN9XIC9_9DINO|nr:unnamed protein product [Polarella glacialis]
MRAHWRCLPQPTRLQWGPWPKQMPPKGANVKKVMPLAVQEPTSKAARRADAEGHQLSRCREGPAASRLPHPVLARVVVEPLRQHFNGWLSLAGQECSRLKPAIVADLLGDIPALKNMCSDVVCLLDRVQHTVQLQPRAVALAPLGAAAPARPDGGSIFPREALDLACGAPRAARLRNPLCQCRGTPRPFLDRWGCRRVLPPGGPRTAAVRPPDSRAEGPPLGGALADRSRATPPRPRAASRQRLGRRPPRPCRSGSPWTATAWIGRPCSPPSPRRASSARVTLFEDDMHDFGLSSLFVRLYVAETFWIAISRCFLRVDGIKCRLIESRYTCRFGSGVGASDVVHRRSSWREAGWDAVMKSMGPGFPIEQINDSTSQCLPDRSAPVTEELSLAAAPPPRAAPGPSPRAGWELPARLRGASCVGERAAVIPTLDPAADLSLDTPSVPRPRTSASRSLQCRPGRSSLFGHSSVPEPSRAAPSRAQLLDHVLLPGEVFASSPHHASRTTAVLVSFSCSGYASQLLSRCYLAFARLGPLPAVPPMPPFAVWPLPCPSTQSYS